MWFTNAKFAKRSLSARTCYLAIKNASASSYCLQSNWALTLDTVLQRKCRLYNLCLWVIGVILINMEHLWVILLGHLGSTFFLYLRATIYKLVLIPTKTVDFVVFYHIMSTQQHPLDTIRTPAPLILLPLSQVRQPPLQVFKLLPILLNHILANPISISQT